MFSVSRKAGVRVLCMPGGLWDAIPIDSSAPSYGRERGKAAHIVARAPSGSGLTEVHVKVFPPSMQGLPPKHINRLYGMSLLTVGVSDLTL